MLALRHFVCLFIFFHLSVTASTAQQNDSLIYTAAFNNASALFKNIIKENSQLYYGSEYVFSNHNIIGFPFFYADSLVNADISYDHILYKNVPAYYDIVLDKIVIKDFNGQYYIQLLSEKTDSFFITGNMFINFDSASTNHFPLKSGFYEKLFYGDNFIVFVKRQKVEDNYISEGVSQTKYVQYNYYFLKRGNVFYKIENENDLLNLLDDKKSLVEKYIRTNKINFKKEFENSLVQTLSYYIQIK